MVVVGVAGLGVAVAASLLAFVGALGRRVVWVRRCLVGSASATLVSAGALAIAVVTVDLGLAYVVDHSRASTNSAYRLSALWAGAEGSLLLFMTGLAVVAALTVVFDARRPGGDDDRRRLGSASMAGIVFGHAVVVLARSTGPLLVVGCSPRCFS